MRALEASRDIRPHEGYTAARRGRSVAFVVTAALHVIALAALANMQWSRSILVPPPTTVSLFAVKPPPARRHPAAKPVPGEHQARAKASAPAREKFRPATPPLPIARHALGQTIEIALPASPAPPSPIVLEHALPPVPVIADVDRDTAPTWEGLVLASLDRVKRYPAQAQARRWQGVPIVRFAIDREGRVIFARLERASGLAALDEAALELPRRAQPFPRPPAEMPGATIELVVPVEFSMPPARGARQPST
ncbi:TonB family protein [Novosphingobium resinovorum]|uniref:energy transducer TonB family protein n=1 Tax=Novosphingobium resinovorum TaxID=158500 RepID=UPI002ED324CE|nr:TonB family protein [Novosphingobium resinovorum]